MKNLNVFGWYETVSNNIISEISCFANFVTGEDNNEIILARLAVEKLLMKKFQLLLYTATDICVKTEKPSYRWKKLENVYISSYTSLGAKTFDSLDEAKFAAINQTDANGFTFDQSTKKYSLRTGPAIIDHDYRTSWIKIPDV